MYKLLWGSLIIAFISGAVEARFVELTPVKDSGLYFAAADGNSNRGIGGRFDIYTNDSALIQFDLSTTNIHPWEIITAATLQIWTANKGPYPYNMNIVAYPLADSWQEGTGTTANISGSTGFPWGPASIGDACYNYQEITGNDILNDTNSHFNSMMIATSGIPWSVAGAKGIGTDILDFTMINETITGKITNEVQSIALMTLSDDGINVLNAWHGGTMDNNGMCMFATHSNTNFGLRVASREFLTPEYRPLLTLKVHQEATLIIFK